jgi:hypothetical protein
LQEAIKVEVDHKDFKDLNRGPRGEGGKENELQEAMKVKVVHEDFKDLDGGPRGGGSAGEKGEKKTICRRQSRLKVSKRTLKIWTEDHREAGMLVRREKRK